MIKVTIVIPSRWYKKPFYILDEALNMAGVTVPVGFKTDGATTPRILWSIFPPVGVYFKATVVHDYLLTICPSDRKSADQIFRKCLIELKIPTWRVIILYYSVRIFGIIKHLWISMKNFSTKSLL